MKKIESGRSMVEMLGVLAIIGVLSVGGIAGYTMAMNKYRANEIAALASQCGILAVAKASVGGAADDDCLTEYGLAKPGFMAAADTMTVTVDNDKATVAITTAASYADALAQLATNNDTLEITVN